MDDKLKTERELPPLYHGPDFTCKHFQYEQNKYFHLHGGIEFDIGTPLLGDVSDEIKSAFEDLQCLAASHLSQLREQDTSYRENYSIPVVQFEGRSYYVISIELETFYQQFNKTQWWGAMLVLIKTLKIKRLPLNDIQLHEQFKKTFGYKKALKCKNLSYGLKSAAERGLSAIFHTFSRKNSPSRLGFFDEYGYSLIHYAAIHNQVPIISQLAMAGLQLNQRRSDKFISSACQAVIALSRGSKAHQDQICQNSGVGPLIGLLWNSKTTERTLLSVIKALGTLCIGVSHTNNPFSQKSIVEELPILVELLISQVFSGQGVSHTNNPFSQKSIVEELPILVELLISQVFSGQGGSYRNSGLHDVQKRRAANSPHGYRRIVILAKVIVDVDQVTLSARGVTILIRLLTSQSSKTDILIGSAHRYHLCADSGGAKMNTRCPPKRVPSAARFFTLCRLTVQPPQSYSVGGQRSSGQLTGKPAGARPDYRGRWCAHLCADSGGAKMNTRCPPKRVLSARFFTLSRLTVQPPQSYSVGGQRSSGQLTRQARRCPARLQGSLVCCEPRTPWPT
ncbi:UNVERIFIED_CONTAM: hypothetical protein FKN15_000130 [Acipenser sinensis]